jgi:hypothetical protein
MLLLISLNSSCKKDKTSLLPSNNVTLSSQTFGSSPYYYMGYSFEKQAFYERIASSSNIDIYLNELIKLNGEPTDVQFTTNTVAEATFGFYLNAEFPDLTQAEAYYANYKEANFPEWITLSDTIRKYQVYTFKTWKSNYVKFLVKDIRTFYKANQADFIEVDIKYFIQRDGTKNLSD